MYKLDKFLKPDALPSMDDTLNLYSGNPADDLQFKEGDIPMLRPQEEDTMQAPQEGATMSVPDPISVAQEAVIPPMSAQEKLIQEYKKLSEQSKEELNSARERDDNSKYMDRMLQAGAMANKALASQGGYNVDVAKPVSVESDFAKRVKEDAASRLKNLIEQSKLGKGKPVSDLDKAKLKTEELKQSSMISQKDIAENKAKQEAKKIESEVQAKVDRIDEQMSDLKKADAGLKKGGVTGLWDNTGGRAVGMAVGTDAQKTRQLLDKIETQVALMGADSLKGTISDKDLDLLKQEFPSKFGDESNIREWIASKTRILEKARKALKSSEGAPEKKDLTNKQLSGKVAVVKGKRYKVAEDGDSLVPLE